MEEKELKSTENTVDNKGTDRKGKLFKQIMKFAVVGGLSFVIDFVVYTIVIKNVPGENNHLIAGVAGFSISLIFNYIASMAFVFERKDDASRKKEFTIFLVLSLIGLGLNEILLGFYVWICNVQWIYDIHNWLYTTLVEGLFADCLEFIKICAKIFATAIVMVYNFISRKMTLEKKD